MITKFENLDEKIQVAAKVYYSTAIMLHNARTKLYELESVNKEKFDKARRMSNLQLSHIIKIAKNAEVEKFYRTYLEARKDSDYYLEMLFSARDNYTDKALFDGEFNRILPPLLLEQVDELGAQIPENVKQLVVATVNAKEESEKRKYYTKFIEILRKIY